MQLKTRLAASHHHATSWHRLLHTTCVFLALFTTAFALIPTMGPAVLAASRTPTPQPNHTTATAGAASVLHLPPAPSAKGFTPKTTPQPIGRQGTPSMTPGSVPLTPDKDATFTGNDGKLTVKVPAGAVSASDVSTAGGSIALKITQIAPASGAAAGGSGLVSFGTYLFDIVDSNGQHLTHGLRKNATLTFQYGSRSSAVDLDHAYAIFNGSLPHGTQAVGPVGAYTKQKVTHDPKQHTLTVPWAADPVVSGVSGTKQGVKIAAGQSYPKTTVTWVTNAYVATYGKPDPLSVDLNAGSLTEGLPIAAPPGPGGTLPNITLNYSSAVVNQQHSPQGAAGWVGEGWNLSLGQISWTEHNALSNTNTPNWEDSWQLVDPFGTSATLIPPNINVATYYDDTPNSITPSPVQWHTSAETYDKIYSFVGPNSIGMPTNPPCFRVYQPSGIMEEFGCTLDSLQYYYVPGAGDYIANWNLDLITNPQGNQVHVTYQQDLVTTTYHSVNYTYPRDTVLSTIEWDSPSCTSANTMCTGATWAPLNRVSFGATHSPTRLTNSIVATASSSVEGFGWSVNNAIDGNFNTTSTSEGWTSDDSSNGINHTESYQLDLGSPQTISDVDLSPRNDGVNTGYGFPIDFTIATSTDGTTWTTDVTKTGYALPTAGDIQRFTFAAQTARYIKVTGTNLRSNPNDSNLYRMQFAEVEAYSSADLALTATPSASSSLESSGWGVANAKDSSRLSNGTTSNGWTSNNSVTTNHTEWYQLDLGSSKAFNEVELYPRTDGTNAGYGYPNDFTIATSPDGTTWTTVVSQTSTPFPPSGVGQRFSFPPQTARYVRVTGTNLRSNPSESNAYRMQFAEVEVHNSADLVLSPLAHCNTGSNVRCDDPLDLSGSGGLGAPEEQTTFALNDITVQTRSTGTGTWNNLHDYQLSYEQAGPTTRTDPASGLQDSMAGMFDLTAVKEIGSDGTTSQPATTYSYATQTEYYEDSTFYPYSTSFCGPTWNTGGNGGSCDLWSQSYDGNSRYISSVSNGLGEQQTFTWANARNNTHGSSSPADPLYCNSHQTGYPCNSADDQAWSRIVVTGQSNSVKRITQNGQGGTQTTTPVTSTYAYTYQITDPLTAQECTDCVASMYWGNQNDGDYLDYYNSTFMGFNQASVSNPDGSMVTHKYYATEGFGVYDNTQVTSCPSNLPPINTACHNAPWWHVGNAAHGQEYEADFYDTNGTTLLKKTTATYQAVCPPGGVSASPSYNDGTTTYTWDGNLVAELDHNNPVAVCDVQKTQDTSTTYDGTSNPVTGTNSYTYDTGATGNYGRLLQTTSTTSVGASNPATIVSKKSYVWNDAVSASGTGATGTYIVNAQALAATEDGSGNRSACAYTGFDGHAYTTGQTSGLMYGNATTNDSYTSCGTSGNSYTPSGLQRSTQTFDAYGNQLTSEDPDANFGVAGHTGCMVGGIPYTNCQAYDTTTQAKPTVGTNALNQNNTTTYGSGSASTSGFGWWPSSTTDANSQIIAQTYDVLGRVATKTLPNESGGNSTETLAYTNWCSGTSAQTPCLEVDTTQRLDNSTTVMSRSFYDGMNRLVETRAAAPGSQDVVKYSLYNAMGQITTNSVKYFVTAYTGAPGASAYSIPDTSVAVSTAVYDGQSRITSTTDALSHTTTTSYTVKCSPVSGDSNCYEQTTVIDANHHQSASFTDGLGRSIYAQAFTGTSPYTLYWTGSKKYDTSGHAVSTTYPDGTHTSTATYDGAGHKTASSDPDLGNYTYGYDQNGNLISVSDPRGASGTIYMGYDGLNRVVWKSTNSNGSSPFATYTYDNSVASANGVGRLATESFTSNGVSGSYAYTYDGRGEPTSWTMTLGGTNYAFQLGYNDAGQKTSVTYPDGDVVTTSYGAQGWKAGVTEALSGVTTTLLNTVQYQGAGGAGGQPTSAQIGNSQYTWTGSYDVLVRPTDTKMQSGSTTLFDQTHTYDSLSNVTTTNTTLSVSGSAKTDNQTFCYDTQNRLVWAGATGTPSCGSSLTAGTLTSAQYQQSYSYDTLSRLTNGPMGSGYTYGDSNHLDAVTSTSSGYGAAYDAAGDMTCRAPTTSQTCSGTQTGQQMAYDAVNRLLSWQNAASSPTQTASYAYDGDGQRVQQTTTNAGVTTTTKYVGSYEDISTTSGTTTTTKYYDAGLVHVTSVSGTLSYLVADDLHSVSMALSSSGSVQATQLFAPYGSSRYSSGTMPTSHGFTGQRGDPSGLDYFNARYYDPSVGQFTSADSVQGPNRYAYVSGNPETLTDPSGNCAIILCVAGFALAGAAIGYVPQVVSNVQHNGLSASAFTNVNWKPVIAGAVGGAVAGLGFGVLGGSLAAQAVTGAASGAAYKATDNVLNNRPIGQGVGQAAAGGALAGAAFWGAGKILGAAGRAIAGGCNSFDPATVVATSHGEQAIGSLKVGDVVQAYDPATGKVQDEPVQHVFINHDDNLLDVTLSDLQAPKAATTTTREGKQHEAATSAHSSQASLIETLHTTTEHPFLTDDRGFVDAVKLVSGEHIKKLDGSVGVVVKVVVVPGQAVRYNLTVRDEHTFAVGTDQWIVHNCSIPDAENYRLSNLKPNGDLPGAGAGAEQSGATDLYGYAGEPNVENPGFDVTNHPNGAGCAEVICASKVVQNIEAGTNGWQKGKPITMYISQAGGKGPCVGCDSVLHQLASYNEAPITAIWQDARFGVTQTVFRPGVIPFGG